MSVLLNSKYLVKIIHLISAMMIALGVVGCSTMGTPAAQPITASTSVAAAGATTHVATQTPAPALPPIMPAGAGGPPGLGALFSVVPTYKDLAYGTVSEAEKLDLYIPTTGSGPFPLVIMIHGGAFMFGDKTDGGGLAGGDQVLSAGYALASINYRLSGEAKYPAQIQDAKAAVRFLRANAKKYNLNPDKFAAWGASAGGNLASLLGTTCGVATLEGAGLGNADQSSCVQAVVDWFGPIDFLKMDEQFSGTGCPANHNDASSPESQLVGAPIQTVADLVKTTNPTNYITEKTPSFLIQNGSADCNVPPIQSKNFVAALTAVIGADKVTYTPIDGAGHGGSQFSTAENLALVVKFLDKYLK
jgi:acetyl esterase/lipase